MPWQRRCALNEQQLFWTAIILCSALLAVTIWNQVKAHRRLRAHQAACTTPDYAPRETFTGSLRHLDGLPVPSGMKLGVAANHGYGLAFAKRRFRYTLARNEIAGIEIRSQLDRKRTFWEIWPHRYLIIKRREGSSLLLSFLPGNRFAHRLQQMAASDWKSKSKEAAE